MEKENGRGSTELMETWPSEASTGRAGLKAGDSPSAGHMPTEPDGQTMTRHCTDSLGTLIPHSLRNFTVYLLRVSPCARHRLILLITVRNDVGS